VSIFGAGDGATANANTVLDANGAGQVLEIGSGVTLVTLQRLRMTDGRSSTPGTGIYQRSGVLRMTECTVNGNTTLTTNGGGIYVEFSASLEMTRCTVRENYAPNATGGGIYALGPVTLTDCLIEDNEASSGGGLAAIVETTTLAGSTRVRGNNATNDGGGILASSAVTVSATSRVTGNTAGAVGDGGGIYSPGATVTLAPGSLVCGNAPDQCVGFSNPACQTTCPS
jgi:predicted outer membrane repeat protein